MSLSGILSSSQVTSLITAAENQYNAPVKILQGQEIPLQTQISALGNISSILSSLQSATQGLDHLSALAQTQATVGNSGILSASANNTAQSGTYQVTVSGLAAAQSLYSQDFSSQNTTVGTGTIGITVGSGTTVNVQISSTNNTLAGIENAINGAGAGVSASLVYDGTGYRLVVAGNQTGAANSFTISTTGSALSGFTYSSGTTTMTESQSAQNASATVNGIAVTSATNSFSGTIPGVSFAVSATGSTTIDVSPSSTAAKTAIANFVNAFNAASTAIQKATAYTPGAASGQSGSGGPLMGNPIISSIENQMLSLISTTTAGGVSGGADAIGFGNAGITLTSSGTITINSGALTSALSTNYNQVLGLFGAMGGSSNPNVQYAGSAAGTVAGVYTVNVTTNSSALTSGTVNGYSASGSNGSMTVENGPAQGLSLNIAPGVTPTATLFFNQGVAQSLGSLLSSALGTNGTLQQAENSNQSQITAMNKQITSYEKTTQAQIQAMIAQFSAYENASSSAGQTSNELNAIFSNLFGGSSGG
ncbi:hypothetical protein BBC27_14620 [Acidithiobacillus ferrivorans]|uniref:Flagellar hook-associated protein 2 n=1 Tax=Acidithiobacillus ferrivorans TaxID=160808 RepID=A0A1B9BWU1_9PROT|nr:flagellar filament capping protein FliD [Acidithiobacillus ferrivorans]OCB02133.1 hypothetical protein BBC27_14620 [Acidithiobacillus ferrivorans]